MGNCATSWHNKEAEKYAYACVNIFGRPDIYVRKAGGAVIWKSSLRMRTLFGKQIVFDRVMVCDENIVHGDHVDFLHCWVPLSMDAAKRCDVEKIVNISMYDNLRKKLILRCGSLENIIAGLYACTELLLAKADTANGKSSGIYEKAMAAVNSGDPDKRMANTRDLYMKCLANLDTLHNGKEHLVNNQDPWYALPGQGEPHASNYAQDIAAVDLDDERYYHDLDSWMKTRSDQSLFPQIVDLPTSLNQFSNQPVYIPAQGADILSRTLKPESLINFPRYENMDTRSLFHTVSNPNPLFGREYLDSPVDPNAFKGPHERQLAIPPSGAKHGLPNIRSLFHNPAENLRNLGGPFNPTLTQEQNSKLTGLVPRRSTAKNVSLQGAENFWNNNFIGPTTSEKGQPAGANNPYANYGPVIGSIFSYHDKATMNENMHGGYHGLPPVKPLVNDGDLRYVFTPKYNRENFEGLIPLLHIVDREVKKKKR